MNKTEAVTLVTMLVTSYPGTRFDEGNAAAYEAAIADLDARETQDALADLVRTSRFLPSIADIRSEVFRLRKTRQAAAAEQERLLSARAPSELGPGPHEWARTLATMLEDQARFERMTKAWCEKNGKPYSGDPGAPFVALAQAGARGDDVRGRFQREVIGYQEEQERRYP